MENDGRTVMMVMEMVVMMMSSGRKCRDD